MLEKWQERATATSVEESVLLAPVGGGSFFTRGSIKCLGDRSLRKFD